MDAWDRTRVTEVEALRAIAHPLRARLLGALRHEGPATATELAARFGESSGSTSYHLRQLERYGFIVEDEDQRSKRERRWRAAAKFTSWDDADFVDQPEGREASDAMHDLQVHWLLKRDRQWRDRRLDWDRAWLGAAGTSDVEVRLTPAATRRFVERFLELAREAEREVRGRARRRDRLDPRPDGPGPPGRPRLMPATPAGLVRRFALLSALRWFPIGLTIPVNILLMQARGLDLAAIGGLYAIYGIVTIALELPTGGLADVVGRRTVLVAAPIATTVVDARGRGRAGHPRGSPLAMVLGATGRALGSGPLDAWYVDATHAIDPEASVRQGLSRGQAAEALALGLGAVIGGLLPSICLAIWPTLTSGPIIGLSVPVLLAAAMTAANGVAIVLVVHERRPAWVGAGRSRAASRAPSATASGSGSATRCCAG